MANITNGTVSVTVSGGVGPYQYTLLNAGTNLPVPQNAYPTFQNPVNSVVSNSFTFGNATDYSGNSGVVAGDYKIKIVDGNGCETFTNVLTVNANTPSPTATPAPTAVPTATPVPDPTATPVPDPTATPVPDPTATPVPDPTATPVPDPTATPVPDPTATAIPSPTFDCTTAQLQVSDGVVGDGVLFSNGGNAISLVPAQYILGSNTYTATIIVPATDSNGNAFSNAGASIECTDTATGIAIPDPTATPVPTAEPTATPVPDPTATPVPDPTATPVPTAEPTATPVPTAEPTATPVPPTATPVPTAEPTATPVPPTATPVPTAEPTATPVPDPTATAIPDPTATPVPDPTATPVPDPTATPVPTADAYYFHLGSGGYPYAQDLIGGTLYKADNSVAANYDESFADMLANPGSYEQVNSLSEIVNGTSFTIPASSSANFYWIAIPVDMIGDDLTVHKRFEIDGAPADSCSEKLPFVGPNGTNYNLYKLNTVPMTIELPIVYAVNS